MLDRRSRFWKWTSLLGTNLKKIEVGTVTKGNFGVDPLTETVWAFCKQVIKLYHIEAEVAMTIF